MTDRSTEHSAETGQLPPAGQSSLKPASCRSLLLEISAGCPEEQQQSKSSGNTSKFEPGIEMKTMYNPASELSAHRLSSADTLADARWLGSSLDCRAPTPRLGSWVWKTDMRPPVGDSSLKAACRAEPRADWVSIVFWNRVGRLFSRSCTSWKTQHNVLEKRRSEGHSQGQQIQNCYHVQQHREKKVFMTSPCIDEVKLPTSLHSLRLTRRLSGVGKKISVAQTDKNTRVRQMLICLATDIVTRTLMWSAVDRHCQPYLRCRTRSASGVEKVPPGGCRSGWCCQRWWSRSLSASLQEAWNMDTV